MTNPYLIRALQRKVPYKPWMQVVITIAVFAPVVIWGLWG